MTQGSTKSVRPSYPAVVPVKVEMIPRKQVLLVVHVSQGKSGGGLAGLHLIKKTINES